jgi:glycosyltransferase involved in cell wall biosynthesis
MRKTILVKGPVLSQSGYGEQARFALRALRTREDIFDIYICPIAWGKTGWVSLNNEERHWIDERVAKFQTYTQHGGTYDMSLQITIPNEWENLASTNIGYTAGIETTKASPLWVQKANEMDHIIVVSNHAGETYKGTRYTAQHPQTGQPVLLECDTSFSVVNYPVRHFEAKKLELDLEYNFNYLAISQWGPRKNFNNLINWFIEENYDQEVGLILKTSIRNNSIIDRVHTEQRLKNILEKHGECKCKVYLIHGDLTEEEMTGLYRHPKVKCLISTTHGEGFGLPLFEAAYNGLPIVTTNWSGQKDFLNIAQKMASLYPTS